MDETAIIVLHAYDGTRRLFTNMIKWSATTYDGRAPSQGRARKEFRNLVGGAQTLTVPFFDNFGDLYTVIAKAKGFEDSAWYPVNISKNSPVTLNLMFLAKGSTAKFTDAAWEILSQARPNVAAIIQRGCKNANSAAAMYTQVSVSMKDCLACFLNIMTALSDMRLHSGKSPLDYYWNACWPRGDPQSNNWNTAIAGVLKPDRFFCYVDEAILQDIRDGVGHGFSKEPDPQAWGHTGATESYKQTQFDVANVQLTFHGRDKAKFTDENNQLVTCVKVEPDIDYYKDVAAHSLIEVIPNLITKNITDPKIVYELRWMAAKREGLAEFDPLYTVEPEEAAST
jgi:hypothetical protein